MEIDIDNMIVTKHFMERWSQRFSRHDPGNAIESAYQVPYYVVAYSARKTKGPKFLPANIGNRQIFLYNPDIRALFVVCRNGDSCSLVTVIKLKIVHHSWSPKIRYMQLSESDKGQRDGAL